MDRKFREKYPNLARELEGGPGVEIAGVRSIPEEAEKAVHDKYQGYDPTAIDFLRRCKTDEDGIEIIDYLYKKGEIEKDYADELKIQLLSKGIRSFGPLKETGHYLKGL